MTLATYAERAFYPNIYTGEIEPVAHCAARDEHKRLERARRLPLWRAAASLRAVA